MNRQLVYFLQRVASSAASAAVYILADKLASGLQPKAPYRGKQQYKQPYRAQTTYRQKQKPAQWKQTTPTVTRSKSEQARDKLTTRRP